MARKKPVAAPPAPSPERVERSLQSGDLTAALAIARDLHRLAPTAENLALLKRTLRAAAAELADRDNALEFNRLLAEADAVDPDDPAWRLERACLLARGGRRADALERVDESSRARILGEAADRAIRTRSKEFLPEEMHGGFDAVVAAFRHHEAGDEVAARTALEPIGLRSPFLEWKVLLRGLLALATDDKARAGENFERLDPERMPARLAIPLRAGLSEAYFKSLPAGLAAKAQQQSARLFTSPLIEHLRTIAQNLGRDRPLTPVFRAAEHALPLLRKSAPALVPRLANCLYHAILQQGQPQDLARYRKLFGNPAEDPGFHRLQAQIAEQLGDLDMSNREWQKYEVWLAAVPPGWPPPVAARARAMIWTRMGEHAEQHAEQADSEFEDGFGFLAPPRRRKKPKPLEPSAELCYTRAATLAPDWNEANRHVCLDVLDVGKTAAAEAAIRRYLALQPGDLAGVRSLADLLSQEGRTEEATDYWLKAISINPLDEATRMRAASAILALARRKLAAGAPAEASAVLDHHATLLEERSPATTAALRSVIFMKERKPDEAAAARQVALTRPGTRLCSAYHILVDSQLAKLKPPEQRAAEKLFADELTPAPKPLEVNLLIAAYDSYHLERISYRGQKSHEKKVLDQVARCIEAEAPEIDFECLASFLAARHQWKLVKNFTDACIKRFRSNPAFYYFRCEAGLETGERHYKISDRLHKAKQLAEKSTEPRHQGLLEPINEMLKEVAPRFNFLDAFFNRDPW